MVDLVLNIFLLCKKPLIMVISQASVISLSGHYAGSPRSHFTPPLPKPNFKKQGFSLGYKYGGRLYIIDCQLNNICAFDLSKWVVGL